MFTWLRPQAPIPVAHSSRHCSPLARTLYTDGYVIVVMAAVLLLAACAAGTSGAAAQGTGSALATRVQSTSSRPAGSGQTAIAGVQVTNEPVVTPLPQETATERATATPRATTTPQPTATPQATATPQPTATAQATATPRPEAVTISAGGGHNADAGFAFLSILVLLLCFAMIGVIVWLVARRNAPQAPAPASASGQMMTPDPSAYPDATPPASAYPGATPPASAYPGAYPGAGAPPSSYPAPPPGGAESAYPPPAGSEQVYPVPPLPPAAPEPRPPNTINGQNPNQQNPWGGS